MTFSGVNYLAIVIAAVVAWLAGAGWYMGLGKIWMDALGVTPAQMEEAKNRPGAYLPFIYAFVAELFRFGNALGARPETLTGVSGLGDLILTCSSTQSRNYSLGIALGKGGPPASAGNKLAEGVHTAPVLLEMANARGIEMPIAAAVVAILAGTASVDEAIERLLMRPLRAESQ